MRRAKIPVNRGSLRTLTMVVGLVFWLLPSLTSATTTPGKLYADDKLNPEGGSGTGGTTFNPYPDLEAVAPTVTQVDSGIDYYRYRIDFTVWNNAKIAYNFTDSICYSNSSTCDNFTVNQLGTGSYTIHTAYHNFLKGPQFETVSGFADVNNDINESNESNNEAFTTFQPSIP
ncbi:MAG: hypothetical protein HY092_02465 [Candidatus Kerfeldbacteria bacterium]|nr:hypothetical protein [Candidatus Kerfeldbacteria bacterium]